MKTTFTILTAGLLAVAAPAFADSNKDAAQNMAAALKGGGGGNNSPIKDALGLEGNGGVASYVSGGGNGGWGNVGSGLVGDQVSKRNK
ncbi:hypothetical protein [Albidovulum sediminis]|uniref:Uncharacterized protein n=1 Tax=Albidovulum sediminis TaxID=3066345 RepID=A0ABT2NLF0_9RHOB|nr:hypothetical protein [Defluviimonas sediminis]MCT8329709.1 hypothetical protein [Defluviimonas sediminis]